MGKINKKKIVAFIKKWIEKPENKTFFRDHARHDMERFLKDDNFNTKIMGRLHSLSNWESMNACYLLWHDDPEGWARMQACFLYKAWPARIMAALRDRLTEWKSFVNLWEVMLTFGHAMATGQDAYADWQGPHFIDRFHKYGEQYYLGWKNRPFEPL